MPRMTATRPFRYASRALKPGDVFTALCRDARLLEAIGKARRYVPEPAKSGDDELAGLRAEYQRIVGRRPFHGWDAATLREKMAAAASAVADAEAGA